MNDFLDNLWESIEAGLNMAAQAVDGFLSPLEVMGPALLIFLLALGVVLFTRLANRLFNTRRLQHLKDEFDHWHKVRQEAAQYKDKEKGKAMAKNIDQAKLNQVYYDYFFEGLMKSLVTNVLPILVVVAYLSKIYTPANLELRFGSPWIFVLTFGEKVVNVGTLFWYIISLLTCFILYGIVSHFVKRGSHH
ncbi:MAG: hypothetical protein MI747_25035 [Desulfobacterales bacterium]|nr:hypothetical protein [Desulfobacterales bacterium]